MITAMIRDEMNHEALISMKQMLTGIFIAMVAFFNPISGEMQALLWLFACNFMFGLIAGVLANEGFQFKKAFRAVLEATVFFIIVVSIFYIGERKGNANSAVNCISFVTYSIVYFYTVNILRNILIIMKNDLTAWKVIKFLYDVLTIEFVKKIPYLEKWIQKNEKITDENNS